MMSFHPIRYLTNLLFPAKCVFCRKDLPYDTDMLFCESCRLYALSLEARELPIPKGICLYILDYIADVRRAILSYKFYGKPQYAVHLASFLAPAIASLGDIDIITWAPVSEARLLKRGYDQSRLLAEALGRELGLPAAQLLQKHRHTRRQSRLSGSIRRKNVRGAYSLAPGARVTGLRIVLIDDIVTTGSTIAECRDVLAKSGAAEVICAALAH